MSVFLQVETYSQKIAEEMETLNQMETDENRGYARQTLINQGLPPSLWPGFWSS